MLRRFDALARTKLLTSLRHLNRTMSSDHPLVLYGDDVSPPVRFVRMTASLLNIDVDYRIVDIFKGENHSEFYKKINPLHKIPSLAVGSQNICDSHAIAMYLCQISANPSLYPCEPLTRARINEMLFFNATTLFPIDSFIYTAYFSSNHWPVGDEKIEQWNCALDHLEYKLNGSPWLAGDEMYICDLCIVATVTSMEILIPITERHCNVLKWMKRLENISCYDINKKGLEKLSYVIKEKKNR